MTAVEPYTGNSQPAQQIVRVQPRTVVALTEWAQAAQAAYEVAVRLVTTSFVPEAFRGKPAEATAAILAGDEVGLSPMASLRSFDIIQGTAAPRAMTQRAIVQAKGHEVWVHESTDSRSIVRGRRAGSDIVQESVWDVGRARALGLTGKHNWKVQPKAMLVARATAECCRLVAADALLGIPYAVEEIADGVIDEPRMPAEETPAVSSRTAQRRSAPKATASRSGRARPVAQPAGPPLPGEDDSQELPVDDREARAGQLTRLGATFAEHGITDRATRLEIVRALVGRPVQSSAELTLREASDLVDTIDGLAEQHGPDTGNALLSMIEEDGEADE
jgi:hypothetical protein